MFRLRLLTACFIAGVLLAAPVSGQRISVEGIIVNETGEHLREVTVLERLAGIGTISDQTGSFRLVLHAGEVELVVREKNYLLHTERFTVRKDTTIVVKLTTESGSKESMDAHVPAFTEVHNPDQVP